MCNFCVGILQAQDYSQLYYHDPTKNFVYTDAVVTEKFHATATNNFDGTVIQNAFRHTSITQRALFWYAEGKVFAAEALPQDLNYGIFSSDGRLFKSGRLEKGRSGFYLGELPSGLHLLRIEDRAGPVVLKINN